MAVPVVAGRAAAVQVKACRVVVCVLAMGVVDTSAAVLGVVAVCVVSALVLGVQAVIVLMVLSCYWCVRLLLLMCS